MQLLSKEPEAYYLHIDLSNSYHFPLPVGSFNIQFYCKWDKVHVTEWYAWFTMSHGQEFFEVVIEDYGN
jgi:hypothetical protein